MKSCTRTFTFDAAHRVLNHKSKCRVLHGHTYKAEITFSAQDLDVQGFVLDFGDIKDIVGTWINENWDHRTILNSEDPLAKSMDFLKNVGAPVYLLQGQNPTAENLAETLSVIVNRLLWVAKITTVKVTNVRMWETPNCFADYSYSEPY